MRLHVIEKGSGQKVYLKHTAQTRSELAEEIGRFFSINDSIYSVGQVNAEPGDSTALGMVLGGAMGLMGGVPGVVIGGVLGGLVGREADEREKAEVQRFNAS